MGDILLWILSGAVMVGVLVVVHEAGHFVVARLFGVGTPVFSIGIGPRVFGFHFWQTEFRISLLPIGGYVRMAGADAFGEEDIEGDEWLDPEEDFMSKPVWQRFLIMLAGPAANLILPFILFTAVLMLGEPQSDPRVGTVRPGSVAEQVGFVEQDAILSVRGATVDTWDEALRAIRAGRSAPQTVSVLRTGTELELQLPALPPSGGSAFDGSDPLDLGLYHSRLSSRIGISDPTSPAWRAGLRPGDEISAVDGEEVLTFVALRDALVPDTAHTLSVVRVEDGVREEKTLSLQPDPQWRPSDDEVLPDPWGLLPARVFVGQVVDESAAQMAGVEPGDRLVAIDGTPIQSWQDVIRLVAATVDGMDVEAEVPRSSGCSTEPPEERLYGRSLKLELARDGVAKTLEFRPIVQREVRPPDVIFRPLMGVAPYSRAVVEGADTVKFYALSEAFPRAVEDGQDVLKNTLGVLGKLLTGEMKPAESLGGPIEIIRVAGYAAKDGIHTFARIMGMISFSLGIVNLLPVPVLDGGQILFYAIEGIRGRPLPLVLRERIQMVGVLFLAALMVMVFVIDIGRLLDG